MIIRLITERDYKNVANMIARSVSNSAFTKFYPQQSIDYIKESLNEEGVKRRASWTHFYVIEKDNNIIACGAIGPYWDSKTESSLFNIFVDEKYQGQILMFDNPRDALEEQKELRCQLVYLLFPSIEKWDMSIKMENWYLMMDIFLLRNLIYNSVHINNLAPRHFKPKSNYAVLCSFV